MPEKGIVLYPVSFRNVTKDIGFFYSEVIWNLLEDAGRDGLSVADIAVKAKGNITDQTIRNNLKEFIKMKRIKRYAVKHLGRIEHYKYVIVKRWMDTK